MPAVPRLVRPLAAAVAVGLLVPLLSTSAAHADATSSAQVTGTVTRAFVEHEHRTDATARQDFGAPLTWIRPADGSASVRVPTSALADVPLGATVKATIGARITDSASVDDGLAPAKTVLAASVVAAAPSPTAPTAPRTSAAVPAGTTDTVTVAMVVPAGMPAPTADTTTLADVVNAVNGPAAAFWNSQSRGAVQLAVDSSYDWWSATHDCSDPEALWGEVAQHIGFTRGAGKHLLLYLPDDDDRCAYGLAEVGATLQQGGYAYVRDTTTSVIAHEMGHNFGLLHSAAEECPNGAVEAAPATCDIEEYGDWYDVMGESWTQVGSLNAAQADLLGFLPGPRTVVDQVTGSFPTDVDLYPYGGSGSTGSIALEIRDPVRSSDYFLEYRTATGQDAYLGDPALDVARLTPGLQLRRVETTSDAYSSVLLDGSPTAAANWYQDTDPTFRVGSTVHIPGADVAITLVSAEATKATVHLTQETPIDLAHAAAGGGSGWQGAPTGSQTCPGDGGCSQPFQFTTLYWAPWAGVHAVDDLAAAYDANGDEAGPLGYPVSDDYPTAAGGRSQLFEGGGIHAASRTDGHAVLGAIADKYDSALGESGLLGYPASDEYPTANGGYTQAFQSGTIHWSPATGAHIVRFPMRWAYDGMRGESGVLGYPLTDQYPTPVPGYGQTSGFGQLFQNGGLHYSPLTGTHAVYGSFAPLYDSMRGESGPLGYPRSDPYPTTRNGWSQAFVSGGIHWSPASGVHSVYGTFATYYDSLRGELSPLGYPVSEPYPTAGGGWSQAFQFGGIHWAPGTPVMGVVGAIAQAYDARRGESGPLGYPRGPQYGVRGGVAQDFQRGTITVVNGRTTVTVR